jgi:hypothetical protein
MKTACVVSISVMWMMIGCSSIENVTTLQPQQTEEQQATPFLFEYSFSETPPNPGDGADTIRKFIKIGLKAEYVASEELIPIRNHVGYSYSRNGTLSINQLVKLESIIEKLDLSSINISTIYLARGGGTEYGWGGHVTYMRDGKSYNIKFTSRYSPAQIIDSSTKARILAFIRDMDDFFLEEIKF